MIFSLFSPHFAGAGDQWPMYQANPSHTGFVPVTLAPTKFSLRWQNTISSLPLNPVTAAGGRVFVSELGYFNFNGPSLYALDSISGDSIWSQNLGNVFSVNPPSYDNGKVYIQTGMNNTGSVPPSLYSFDAAAGTLVFRSQFGAQWERYYAPTIYDGNVYIDGGAYGGMYSFDGTTGNQYWFNNGLQQYDQWTPAVDATWAYAYLGSEYEGDPNTGLYVLVRLTGQAVFNIPDPGFVFSTWSMNLAPVLGGLSDVFAIQAGRLIRFDLNARDISWVNAPNFKGQPTVAGGVVYAVSSGALGAYDQTTGTLLWTWPAPAGETLQDTIIATNSHLFVGSAANTYCIDLTTQQEVWSYPAAGHLALAENTLYIAGASGALTAVDLGLVVPDIYAIESVNFGTADVGQTVTQTISITNVGAAPLLVQSIVSSSGEFVLQSVTLPLTIPPHQSALINVQFTPASQGTKSGNLLIASNDPNEPQISVALTGQSYLMHTIIASAGAGGNINPSGNVLVIDGNSQIFTITPDQGYKILRVVVDGKSQGAVNSYTFNSVTGGHSITASFTPIIYHYISAAAGAGGQITPSGNIQVVAGDSLMFIAAPDYGYNLLDITVDGKSLGAFLSSYTFNKISRNHSITATFTPIIYHSISATAGPGGQISPSGSSTVADGYFFNLTITPDPGYQLAALTDNGKIVEGPSPSPPGYTLFNVVADHTITATFAPYLDYFGMQTGNHLDLSETDSTGNTQTYTEDISLFSPSLSGPSYRSRAVIAGNTSDTFYQVLSNGLFMQETDSAGMDLDFQPALPLIKTPLAAGKRWTETVKFYPGPYIPGWATITATVYPQEFVSVPAGNFMAWPIAYRLTLSEGGRTTATAWTDWFAPYFGFIKEMDSNAAITELTGFQVGGGTITTPPPVVTGTVPASATCGSTISINGFQFGASQGGSKVMIGNVECDQILYWSDTQINCTIPDTASSGAVTVVTDPWTSNNSITLTIPPEITGVTPSSGQRGSTVQIQGTAFGTVAGKVNLGAVPAHVTQWGDNSITCTVPATMPYGACPVTVTNSQGQNVLQGAFTVVR